jgi:hypothetical protein
VPVTQECFLKDKRDIFNGFIRDQNYDLLSLKSISCCLSNFGKNLVDSRLKTCCLNNQDSANELNVIEELFPNTTFRFILEYKTPYGTDGITNEILHKQSE